MERSLLSKVNILGIRRLSRPILPYAIKDALEEHFLSFISQLESIIRIYLITAASDDEAREKAKTSI